MALQAINDRLVTVTKPADGRKKWELFNRR